jgi:hypothetical protein
MWKIRHGLVSILRRGGRALTWRQFLTVQADAVIACDFVVVEAMLLQLYMPVFIEHGTRRLHLAGVTARRLCHAVGPSTVWQILKDAGIDPSP